MIDGTFLKGKRGLVMGVANEFSIAWGIAVALRQAGAEVMISYQNERTEKRVRPLAEKYAMAAYACDMAVEGAAAATFKAACSGGGKLDFVVHAMAFSKKEGLTGRYYDTNRDNFLLSMDISAYSFTEIVKQSVPFMNEGGAYLTLTYYGAEKTMPNYNMMGVAKAALEASVMYLAEDVGAMGLRVNAISAGPIKTLAASGISAFGNILNISRQNAPLRRTVTIEEVGNAALFLLSDLSTGVTGEVLHVDAGYHTVGMGRLDS